METNKLRRLISFLVLLAIIILIGASLLPRHGILPIAAIFINRISCHLFAGTQTNSRRFKGKSRLAAAATTTIVALVVLLPTLPQHMQPLRAVGWSEILLPVT